MALLQTAKATQNTAQDMFKAQGDVKRAVTGLQQSQTGKAATGAEFDLSGSTNAEDDGLAELVQQATAQNQQAKVSDTAQLQQQEGTTQQADQQMEAQKNKAVMAKEQFSTQTEELMQKFEQNMDTLGLDRHRSELEQLMFGMRMQNNKYIDQLKMEGDKQRLNDKALFAESLMASALQDEMTLLKGNLEFRQLMFADDLLNKGMLARDDREFARRLGELDIETALQVAFADAEARSEGMRFEAIADMIKATAVAGTDYMTQRTAAKKKAVSLNSATKEA